MNQTRPPLPQAPPPNGIDPELIDQLSQAVAQNPSQAIAGFGVTTTWKGGTKTETRTTAASLGGARLHRDFVVRTDLSRAFQGENAAADPQELLMAALNACLICGYVVHCSREGVELESLVIETQGCLDLRGFLGDRRAGARRGGSPPRPVRPGYDALHFVVRVRGSATRERFQAIHERVLASSPNGWNLGQPVRLQGELLLD